MRASELLAATPRFTMQEFKRSKEITESNTARRSVQEKSQHTVLLLEGQLKVAQHAVQLLGDLAHLCSNQGINQPPGDEQYSLGSPIGSFEPRPGSKREHVLRQQRGTTYEQEHTRTHSRSSIRSHELTERMHGSE